MTFPRHAYRLHVKDWISKYDSRDVNGYDHGLYDFASSANSHREPHVFLDLRNYYSTEGSRYDNHSAYDRRNHHQEWSSSRSSDYICPPSTSRSSRSDYISPGHTLKQYDSSYPINMLDAHDAAAFDKANCTSAWEKPDYQTIKECGWKDENVLEDNHRPSISGPGVFNGVKDVLNGCGRVNAMTVGDNMPGPNDGLHRSNRCSRRRQESIDIYHKEDVAAGLLSDYEDDRRIVSGRESNSTSLATRQRFIACEESSVSGNSDERDGSEESDDGSPSSDGDSTDAIDYYGSGADDSNDEIGSDDPLDDEIIHNYDDDECY